VSKHQRCADDDLDSMETDDTLCMEASDKRVRFGGSASALRVAARLATCTSKAVRARSTGCARTNGTQKVIHVQ
jgi:hypothetical protein